MTPEQYLNQKANTAFDILVREVYSELSEETEPQLPVIIKNDTRVALYFHHLAPIFAKDGWLLSKRQLDGANWKFNYILNKLP